jgi:DNA mismatch repair ATPase MutS
MKAFLLYPDRDFDPTLLLSRRERGLRQQEKELARELEQSLPWNHAALCQDLGLNVLLDTMAGGDGFLFEAAMIGLLKGVTDSAVITYRQEIMRDCLESAAVVRQIYEIVMQALKGQRERHWSIMSRYPAGTLHHAVDVLGVFVEGVKKLRAVADQNKETFKSRGFSRLFSMLQAELSDNYFAVIDQHLRRLKFSGGVLVSAQLSKGNKGTNYVLRRPHRERGWLARLLPQSEGYAYHLHPRDEAGAQALGTLRDRGVNLVANAMAQSMDHISSFFQMLRTELAFYVACLNLYEQLLRLGVPVCFPNPTDLGQQLLSFAGLYDVSLAISKNATVVGNDLNANGKNFIVVTGANTGGKSTFMRSLGLAQVMMQAGMFVPANEFSAEVRSAVVTHYKREEDITMESGKLDEELHRMSEVVERLRPGSMLLMNESFAATNEREGSEIATQITTALMEKGVKICYVTHLYHFAHRLHEKGLPNVVFLRAERRPDGSRTFKLIEAGPLQTSYGEDLYRQVFSQEKSDASESPKIAFARG